VALVWVAFGKHTSCTPRAQHGRDAPLYSPQRLFGEVGSSSDVLSHEPFLERARLQREQERDGSARLALGAYVVARLIDKLLTENADDGLREGYRWQLEAVRRHVAELPANAPETAHLAGIVAAVPSEGPPPPASLWKSLTAYAYFLEHEGRLDESLEMLMLAARSQGSQTSTADFASYALFAGRLNRQLARWEAAISCYSAAEEAGNAIGDSVVRLRGRLGQGAVDRGRGNLPRARETAESVVREASKLESTDVLAMAYADLGAVCGLQGLRLEAVAAQYKAFQYSRDPQQRMQALGDVAYGLSEIGAREAARIAFTIVAHSDARVHIRTNAHLELMELESLAGNRMAFERSRSMAEEYRGRMSPSMTVDYYFKLGTGFSRFGQLSRARDAFKAGLAFAEEHRLNAWYFKVEQALEELDTRPEHQPVAQYDSDLSDSPAVRQMEAELREYAVATVG
jgi:tetratricopeptide (TPR) repeat protein